MKKLILSRRCAAGRAGAVIGAGESYARRLLAHGFATVKPEARKTAPKKAAKDE